ncbi:Retrovirus-related Pol polyprotein from transposon [Porphyridium purpureum]|uniref:Retrovirus-related Pol polyprotein from transposon n=1 Tax=Porphyridium purpureum TaxID=35688 RepID=A0A5J4YL50_PORPP|nr:Retrovirus-related Pol polyprotein from transposon [Porphyridium purpureum]|eukprot:POR5182..scf246_12
MEKLPRLERVKGFIAPWTPVRRFEIVAVDFTTVSPESSRGNKKVLVIVDLFTRYTACLALKEETAETVAQALLDAWIFQFGAPERLLSDNGTAFTGEVITALSAILGIKKVFTSSLHPAGNGTVERMNRTLLSQIRAQVLTDDREWDRHLAASTYAYNVSIHDTTGVSPFEAMYGCPAPKLDRDILFVSEDAVAAEGDLAARLRRLHELVRENNAHRREQVARWYNSKVADFGFVPGRRVMVFDPPATIGVGRKLRYPWRGPYLIQEYVRWNNVIIKSERTGETTRCHVNRLAVIGPQVRESALHPATSGLFPDIRAAMKSICHGRKPIISASVKPFCDEIAESLPSFVSRDTLSRDGRVPVRWHDAMRYALTDEQQQHVDGCTP